MMQQSLARVELANGAYRSYDGRMRDWLVKMPEILRMRPLGAHPFAMFGCLLLVVFFATGRGTAQMMRPGIGGDPSGQTQTPGVAPPEDETQRQMAKKQELRRNEERQKQLVKDTNELLALATQLKVDVDKTDKNVLSVDVVKKAYEIEKLARNVRDRMRSR